MRGYQPATQLACDPNPAKIADMKATQSATTRDIHFVSKGDVQLFGTLYEVSNAKANALIVHGYAEHGGRYDEVAQTLCAGQFNVLCLDLRGHGRSGGDRGYVHSFSEYLDDMEAGLEALAKKVGERQTLLLGHSNGGLASLRLLADPFRCPSIIRAAVISSPFLQLKRKAKAQILFAKAASFVVPKLALPNNIRGVELTHDEEKIREHDSDPLCIDIASAKWFSEAVSTQAWVAEFANRIAVPTLWLVAGMDVLANPEQTRKVQARLTHKSSYHEFAEMRHEVFNEVGRDKVLSLMSDFCNEEFCE